jgi:hypothetical protein
MVAASGGHSANSKIDLLTAFPMESLGMPDTQGISLECRLLWHGCVSIWMEYAQKNCFDGILSILAHS